MKAADSAVASKAAVSWVLMIASVASAATLSGWWWILTVLLAVLAWDRAGQYGAAALARATGSQHPVDDALDALNKYHQSFKENK